MTEGFGIPGFDPAQLLRFLQAQGPARGQLTAEVARWVALGGGDDDHLASGSDRDITDLTRVAQLHVAEATGLDTTAQTHARCVTRGQWVDLAVPALARVLDGLADTLQGDGVDGDPEPDDPAAPFAGFLQALAPMLLGVQSGFMVGHLAQYVHAQHDLPLAADPDPGVVFVLPNLDRFEAEWSLPRDELRLYVALHEVVHAAVRSVPWVARHLLDLTLGYIDALEIDESALEGQLASFDPAHLEELQTTLGDPATLLGAIDSPRRRAALDQVRGFTIVLEGYADSVLARAGQPLLPAFSRIREARQRHRVERGDAQRFIERLLGMELEREQYDLGAAFCDGVIERSGPAALNRLWERPEMLPTTPELEAPGLWLARIDVMES